jgi:ankyrin repeat protein
MRILVDSGVNVNCKDSDENTPLHYASEYGNIEAM